jgi:head-tail adaptor
MQPGRLDRLVQFRRATVGSDAFGATQTWADHGTPLYAQKSDLRDGERWRAGEVQAHVTTRFTVRRSPFTAALTPKDRLTCEGVEFEIVGIKEGAGRRQWVEITCARRNDT